MDSIINFTKLKDIPGLLLFIDFEKASDTLKWSLKYNNFGPSLISWVDTLYCDANSATLNEGAHCLPIYLESTQRFSDRRSEAIIRYEALTYLESNVRSVNMPIAMVPL